MWLPAAVACRSWASLHPFLPPSHLLGNSRDGQQAAYGLNACHSSYERNTILINLPKMLRNIFCTFFLTLLVRPLHWDVTRSDTSGVSYGRGHRQSWESIYRFFFRFSNIDFFKKSFSFSYAYMCTCTCEYSCPWRPEEDIIYLLELE